MYTAQVTATIKWHIAEQQRFLEQQWEFRTDGSKTNKRTKSYLNVRTNYTSSSVNKSSKKHTATLSSKEILLMFYQQKIFLQEDCIYGI